MRRLSSAPRPWPSFLPSSLPLRYVLHEDFHPALDTPPSLAESSGKEKQPNGGECLVRTSDAHRQTTRCPIDSRSVSRRRTSKLCHFLCLGVVIPAISPAVNSPGADEGQGLRQDGPPEARIGNGLSHETVDRQGQQAARPLCGTPRGQTSWHFRTVPKSSPDEHMTNHISPHTAGR